MEENTDLNLIKMPPKHKKTKTIPKDIRRAALRAIKCGLGLEAVSLFNRHADEINETSIYEERLRAVAHAPYRLI